MLLRAGLAAALTTLLLAHGPALAQSTSASLTGMVRDDQGRPVAGAVVQARSESTGIVRSVASDEQGRYRIDLLAPGRWTVATRLADGTVSASRSVVLSLQQTLTLDFATSGGVSEHVEVMAQAPLVDRMRTSAELRILGEQSDALPIPGRSVTELALLDASVQVAPQGNFFGERGSVFVVNGQTGRSNSFLVDGLDNNDQTSGTSLNSFFSQQVIREFVVLTHQYLPEFGRASGGVLNIVTRRGDNDPTGEFFVQGTADGWNDSGHLVESLPQQADVSDRPAGLQAGFRFGGPFKHDRAFYFVAYEHQDRDEVVPYIGLDRNMVLGGWVMAPVRSDNLFFRTDFNLGNSQSLMLRLSADDRTIHDVNVGGAFTPEFGFRVEERDLQLGASLTSIFSQDVINEVRLLLGSSSFDQFANSDRPGVERSSGYFGGNDLNRQFRDEDRIQLIDNVTWKRGPHILKLGLDVTHSRTTIRTRFNPTGNFLYRTDDPFEAGDCGDLVASQVDPRAPYDPVDCPGIIGVDDDGDGQVDEPGLPYTYPLVYRFIFGQPSATLEDTLLGVFAQDSWQLGPRWLLDYGLRYDVSTYRLPDDVRVTSSIPNGGAGRDSNNFAPRFGFTFTPRADGKTVIRGGAGLFYNKLVLAFPAVAAITSGTEIGLLPIQGLTFEITEDSVEQFIEQNGHDAFLDLVENQLQFPEELILRFSTATELETPYTVQYTLGAERALGSHMAASINAVRALGYRVPLMRDLNPVVAINCGAGPEPLGSCEVALPIHRDETTGSIAAITTEGRSWYSGVDLAWRRRTENAWLSVSYTWSKSEDMGPDPLKGGIYLPANSDDLSAEKGLSDHDRRHSLVIAGETTLPWIGLRASGVIRAASGVPFNVTTGLDDNFDGINNDRPPGVGRNSGTDTPLEAINEVRSRARLEDVQGVPDDDPFFQVDLRLTKPFRFNGGKVDGAFFMQVFNLLNRFNPGPVEGRITSQNFGRPTGLAGPPRTLELGFRIGY